MSKKALVRFDPKQPAKQSSDFVVPLRRNDGRIELVSLKTGKTCQYGLVVFTGREVTGNDMFAKLVDAGHEIILGADVLADLEVFVGHLSSFGIGSVLELETDALDAGRVLLRKTALKAGTSKPSGLP